MRIGVFGGTFDPPHNGHLEIALAAKAQCQLDEVLFVPAGRNPLKTARPLASGKHRLRMVELALQGNPGLASCDLEVNRDGPSYTVDTLNELQVVMPGDYVVIMGGDSLRSFNQWKAHERILRMATLAVATRPPLLQADLEAVVDPRILSHVTWVEMKANPVSSTSIRDTLAKGRSVDLWVPKAVSAYISSHNLYKK
jgi:nicotinate-nucleotide adenylyltransferase